MTPSDVPDPKPGTQAAIDQGCTCPVDDNVDAGGVVFYVNEGCPLHHLEGDEDVPTTPDRQPADACSDDGLCLRAAPRPEAAPMSRNPTPPEWPNHPPPPKHYRHDGKRTEAEIDAEKARKPRPDLLPPRALLGAGRAMAYGRAKHGRCTWRVAGTEQATVECHAASAYRHLLEYFQDPNATESGSGLPVLYHLLCQVAIMIDLHEDPPTLGESRLDECILAAGAGTCDGCEHEGHPACAERIPGPIPAAGVKSGPSAALHALREMVAVARGEKRHNRRP